MSWPEHPCERMGKVQGAIYRDTLASLFRFKLLARLGIIPLRHQAETFAHLDGLQLSDDEDFILSQFDDPPLYYTEGGRDYWLIQRPVTEPLTHVRWDDEGEITEQIPTYDEDGNPVVELGYHEVTEHHDGAARLVLMDGSFKLGKSVLGGIVAASYAPIPNLAWDIVGMEYPICEPEFEWICNALLSEKGMNLPNLRYKPERQEYELGYVRHSSRLSEGKGWLELSNGATFACRSWERSEGLKGKRRDGYSWAEFYQFDSVENIRSVQQNLSERLGKNVVPTTPDRPVVTALREACSSSDERMAGYRNVSHIPRMTNPYTFNLQEYKLDLRERSREKVTVYWLGESGEYIGSVYGYKRGQRIFTPTSHPELFRSSSCEATFDNLEVPSYYERIVGADTGTNNAFVIVVVNENGELFCVQEFTNYRYLGTDRNSKGVTAADLAAAVLDAEEHLGGRFYHYADANAQWKREFQLHGITLLHGESDLERRTDVLKEHFQHDRIWLAPWLQVLPYELESAKYPDKELVTQEREKKRDETVDSLEHAAASRPKASRPKVEKTDSWIESFLGRKVFDRDEKKRHPRLGRLA